MRRSATRPASAVVSMATTGEDNGSDWAPSRPQSALPSSIAVASQRSHLVGVRTLPSRSDVQSTASSLSLQPHRHSAVDSLTLLKRLRQVLGFHQQRQQQTRAPPPQYQAKTRPGSAALQQHGTPNPVLRDGQVAFLA